MIATRAGLVQALQVYHTNYAEEHKFKDRFLALLDHPRSFFRDHLPGHITGSALIIDESGDYILLTHHAKLNRWLQPGGHADGDENIIGVSLREAKEETGLMHLQLVQNSIFDIDIHTIPGRSEFPQHDHYDIRFAFRASKNDKLIITNESNDLAWKKMSELPKIFGNEPSMMRMVEKVKRLF